MLRCRRAWTGSACSRQALAPTSCTAVRRHALHALPAHSQQRCEFPPAPDIGSGLPRSRYNAAAMAFLGDSIWEVHMRDCLYRSGSSDSQQYAMQVIERVNTQAQAQCFEVLMASDFLKDGEREVARWALNSTTIQAPSNASALQYKRASAMEVLVAHLYLTDEARLQEFMAHVRQLDVTWAPPAAAKPKWKQRRAKAAPAVATAEPKQ